MGGKLQKKSAGEKEKGGDRTKKGPDQNVEDSQGGVKQEKRLFQPKRQRTVCQELGKGEVCGGPERWRSGRRGKKNPTSGGTQTGDETKGHTETKTKKTKKGGGDPAAPRGGRLRQGKRTAKRKPLELKTKGKEKKKKKPKGVGLLNDPSGWGGGKIESPITSLKPGSDEKKSKRPPTMDRRIFNYNLGENEKRETGGKKKKGKPGKKSTERIEKHCGALNRGGGTQREESSWQYGTGGVSEPCPGKKKSK